MLIFFLKKNSLLLIIYLPIAKILLTMMFTQLQAHEPRQILAPYEMAHIVADLANSKLTCFSFLSSASRIGRMFNVFCPSVLYTLMNTSLRRSNFVTFFNVQGNSIFWKFSIIIYSVDRKIRFSFGSYRADHRSREACIVTR